MAFVGAYDFVFESTRGTRQVRIVLNPKGSNRVGMQIVIDTPGAPIFLGAALGGHRPDVAAAYGERLAESGYGLSVKDLAPGTYNLAVFAWSTARGGFLPAKTARVTVR